MTTIFVSGANRWPPLGACSYNEPTSTDVKSVIKRALLRTGLSESRRAHLENEGRITPDEALAVLNVTHKRPVWLLSQLHPDKKSNRERRDEAARAFGRVVLADQDVVGACPMYHLMTDVNYPLNVVSSDLSNL